MLLAERFLFVGFQLVLLPRSQLVLLVVTFGVYLSMSSRSAPFNLYRISVPRLVAGQVTSPKAFDQRLLVCCSRRIPAQRFCKTARSDHFPSFHLVSSLQLPYIIHRTAWSQCRRIISVFSYLLLGRTSAIGQLLSGCTQLFINRPM